MRKKELCMVGPIDGSHLPPPMGGNESPKGALQKNDCEIGQGLSTLLEDPNSQEGWMEFANGVNNMQTTLKNSGPFPGKDKIEADLQKVMEAGNKGDVQGAVAANKALSNDINAM